MKSISKPKKQTRIRLYSILIGKTDTLMRTTNYQLSRIRKIFPLPIANDAYPVVSGYESWLFLLCVATSITSDCSITTQNNLLHLGHFAFPLKLKDFGKYSDKYS